MGLEEVIANKTRETEEFKCQVESMSAINEQNMKQITHQKKILDQFEHHWAQSNITIETLKAEQLTLNFEYNEQKAQLKKKESDLLSASTKLNEVREAAFKNEDILKSSIIAEIEVNKKY